MLYYGATLACAFALASSVSAIVIPTGAISNIVDSVAIPDSTPTNVVSAIVSSVSAKIQDSTPTGIVSEILSSVSAQDPAPTSVLSAIVSSVISSGEPFPTDVFPAFTQLTGLSCKYGSITVSPATNGIEIPVAKVASAPSFSTSSKLDGEYILIMIDPDVANPQILHFMQPGLVSASNSSGSAALSASKAPAVKYLSPAPPAGSGPHRYTFFLFSQPKDFALSDSFDASDRSGFDLVTFAAEYDLGVPVAGTFFVAENKNGNLTGSPLSGNGTRRGNATHVGGSHNGTIIGGSRGNSTNSTLHGSFLHGNGTSNSTIHGGNRNVNGTSSGGNGTVSISSSNGSNDGSADSSSTSSSFGSSSTGNVPVSPSAAADTANVDSASKSSAYVANFALAGFVALISVGVVSL